MPLTLDLLNPKSIGFDDYHCAKFQVIPITAFRFIVLTYTPHTHIHRDKVITISAPYFVVGADDDDDGGSGSDVYAISKWHR